MAKLPSVVLKAMVSIHPSGEKESALLGEICGV